MRCCPPTTLRSRLRTPVVRACGGLFHMFRAHVQLFPAAPVVFTGVGIRRGCDPGRHALAGPTGISAAPHSLHHRAQGNDHLEPCGLSLPHDTTGMVHSYLLRGDVASSYV